MVLFDDVVEVFILTHQDVDTGASLAHTMLVVAATLTQAPNDKQQVAPILKVLQEQAAKLGDAKTLIADTGYCSENNIKVCEEAKI